MRRHPGLTLIELVIVMMVFAIMATVAVPRFADAIAQSRVEQAARRIQVDLGRAQQRAKSSSTAQTIQFDLPSSSYTISGLSHLDHPTSKYLVNLAESPYELQLKSADLGGDTELVFDGYGAPDSGGTVVVALGKYQKTVTVDPDTGGTNIP